MKRFINFFLCLLILFTFTACTPQTVPHFQRAAFEAHFIDVGDGDAILLIADGKTMMVDYGSADQVSKVRGYLATFGIQKLDINLATHPHEDHIGNMSTALRQLGAGSVYMTKATATTKVYQNMLETLKEKSLTPNELTAGKSFTLGGADVKVLSPAKVLYSDINDTSAVLKVTYKSTSFLLCGDIQHKAEKDIITTGQDLKADVIKVAHHGSGTSSSKEFLKAVTPAFAVISCAKNSQYHYPNPNTVTRLEETGAKVYTTATDGDVVITSDGSKLDVISQKQ